MCHSYEWVTLCSWKEQLHHVMVNILLSVKSYGLVLLDFSHFSSLYSRKARNFTLFTLPYFLFTFAFLLVLHLLSHICICSPGPHGPTQGLAHKRKSITICWIEMSCLTGLVCIFHVNVRPHARSCSPSVRGTALNKAGRIPAVKGLLFQWEETDFKKT